MTNFDTQAVDAFIAHLWTGLQANSLMSTVTVSDYSLTTIPIAPVYDNPELSNHMGSKPYIIYDVYTYPVNPTEWWRYRDEVILSIYCPDFTKTQKISEYLKFTYGRKEESAAALNASILPSNPFIYHTMEVPSIQTYQPVQDEAGRLVCEVTVAYEYARDWAS